MFELQKLNDEQLRAISRQSPCDIETAQVLDDAKRDSGVRVLLDEADGLLWSRILDRQGAFTDEQVAELLVKPAFSTARALLGQAARRRRLSQVQVDFLSREMEVNSWEGRQVELRRLVNELLKRTSCDSRAEGVLQRMADLGGAWAILELIEYCDPEDLGSLAQCIPAISGLSRQAAHQINSAIRGRMARSL